MRRQRVDELAADALLVVVALLLARSHLLAAQDGSVVALLLLVQHTCLITLTLLHRPAQPDVMASAGAIVLAWTGLLLPLLMRPDAASAYATLGAMLVAAGSIGATIAMLCLGRSFGLEPANRGVRHRGLYCLVRHPIYANYLLIIGGFLVSYPSLWNSLVATAWLGVQLSRMASEEALLMRDPSYQAYARRVPYRLIPWIW